MAQTEKIPFTYFEAFDESWKATSTEPDVGSHWGILKNDLTLKSGMNVVLSGATIKNNWSGKDTIDGPGVPKISFTQVAPYGNDTGLVKGAVSHVVPANCQVAIYILVGSQWWTKPTNISPITIVNGCGKFQTITVTGGNDKNATHIAAFLIPKTYTPPLVNGTALPQELYDKSLAYVDIPRN
jgi:hypothetical protein